MADKAWEAVKPAVSAAVEEYEHSPESDRRRGEELVTRVKAALTGSDWRYVKKLGGTLTRDI